MIWKRNSQSWQAGSKEHTVRSMCGDILRNGLIFIGIFAAAVGLCLFLRTGGGMEAYASPIFVLAVLLVSRFTDGYLYGLCAALLGVVCVNYFFTYPYMAVNFSIAGYPLTFTILLIVSMITSTLTTRAKQIDILEVENEKEKIRTDLLRSVSHDIRTPLTSIIGSAGAMIETADMSHDERLELLEDIRKEAQWLLRMSENLLLITRIDQAHEISREPWAVEEVIGETFLKLQKTYPQVHVEVSIPEEPLFVPMDPILIGQVLFNLAENGILHGKTTKTIRISAAQNGKEAVFSVRDDGEGVPEELLRDFEMGRLRTEISPDRGGKRNMGLGLRVCTAIVKEHAGRLQLGNRPDGAEALVVLPLE